MSADEVIDDADRKKNRYHFDRHTPEYRHQFETVTAELQAKCPIAWSDTYGGHWVASGNREVFELARSAEYLSNDHDVNNERRGYKGITIPTPDSNFQGGFLEMDPPEQRHYRQALNPYLSPAAVTRWVPVVEALVRASLDEKLETGPGRRARAGEQQRQDPARHGTARGDGPAHRRRVRHHDRADRARARVDVRAPGPAGAAE